MTHTAVLATAEVYRITATGDVAQPGCTGPVREADVALGGLNAAVFYSRWVDLLPDGTATEGRGVQPDVAANFDEAEYASADPTWEKGLEVLWVKVREVHPR